MLSEDEIKTTSERESSLNIIRVGNVSTGNSQAGTVYDINGVFPTICVGTHGYAMGYILIDGNKK